MVRLSQAFSFSLYLSHSLSSPHCSVHLFNVKPGEIGDSVFHPISFARTMSRTALSTRREKNAARPIRFVPFMNLITNFQFGSIYSIIATDSCVGSNWRQLCCYAHLRASLCDWLRFNYIKLYRITDQMLFHLNVNDDTSCKWIRQ